MSLFTAYTPNRKYKFLIHLIIISIQLLQPHGEENRGEPGTGVMPDLVTLFEQYANQTFTKESDKESDNAQPIVIDVEKFKATAAENGREISNGPNNNSDGIGSAKNRTEKPKFIFGIDYKVVDNTIPGLRDDDDFENWDPPIEFQRDLPYYMSGFDRENQPIWILEWGHYDLHKYLVGGSKEKKALFDKYIRYTAYVALKSHKLRGTPEKPITRHPMIIDLEGFKIERVTNREIIEHQMQLLSQYRRFFENKISRTIVVNVNSVAEVFINLARPFFGRIYDKLELYGTQKSIWAPKLLKHFSKDQIPEWYGGSKGFKPVYVIG